MSFTVKKKPGESKKDLIGRFQKIVLSADILNIVRDKQEYKKPSRRRYEEKKEKEKLIRRSSRGR